MPHDSLQQDSRPLPVAVDAMGGDLAPFEVVAGAVDAARYSGVSVCLVGSHGEVERIIKTLGGPFSNITIIDAPHVVSMEDQAVAAVRRKQRASITVAMDELQSGSVSSVVSAGHSGAVVASGLFVLGRFPGVQRPGIAIPFPTFSGSTTYLIDAGAVVDPRPAHLLQYARLATIYLRQTSAIVEPRIGLLSNGEEQGKGNQFVREVYDLLMDAPDVRFAGNVEANKLPSGEVDAVVCDGFTGNVAIKAAEGAVTLVQEAIRRELSSHWYLKLLGGLLKPAFRRAGRSLDYREYGGAPLLGVRGVVYIAHGRSDRKAIRRAIESAHNAYQRDILRHFEQGIGSSPSQE